MMVKITKNIVKRNDKVYGHNNGIKFITIHETANTSKGANAETHGRLQQNGFAASWHYTVDDKQVVQSFPHSAQCWHAGTGRSDGNLNSIAIEICVNVDGNFKKAVNNAAELVKGIMESENINANNVVQHNHWSGKNCPTNLRNGSKGVNWNDFKELLSGGNVKPPSTQTGSQTTSKPKKTKWTRKSGKWTGQVLKQGDYGPAVKDLQTRLANVYFYPNKGAKNNGVDSYYGANTKDAVRRYQSVKGLNADGIAGKKTYASLGGKKTTSNPSIKYPLPGGFLRLGDRGNKVKQLQRALNKANFKVGNVDGIYGAKTKDAVARFQKVYDAHNVDGIYGKRTKSRLSKKI